MDDLPADSGNEVCGVPPLAVVIPVRNGGQNFERCLRGLRASTWRDYELVVVDDGSTDHSDLLAEQFGARVIHNERPLGPAACRNEGARAASASIVFFIDADVVPHCDALTKVMTRFQADSKLAALFGSYDDQPTAPGLVSQFRNLLHNYVHQQGVFENNARPAHTFWTGCGAIRRDVFLSLGGFDRSLYRRPAIEDIELGYRITRAGLRIELVRDIQATHLKRWTLGSMIRTDILHRGVPWMLLMMWSRTKESDLNVSRSQRLSVAATGLALLAFAATVLAPWFMILSFLSLGLVAVINQRFYRYVAHRRGSRFATACFGPHLLYFLCCGVSVAIALVLRLLLTKGAEPTHAKVRWDRSDSPAFPRPRHARRRSSRWARP